MCVLFLFAAESNIQLYHRGITSTTQTFRQHEFIKYEFHCLDVPRVGAIAVSDAFDCTFECLSNLLCFSVNLAASKGVHGKLWCELLSSDRHRNSTEFKRNESSHHFAIKVRDTETNHFISFVLLLWSWMICINVTTITVIIIINILNIVIIDIWKSVPSIPFHWSRAPYLRLSESGYHKLFLQKTSAIEWLNKFWAGVIRLVINYFPNRRPEQTIHLLTDILSSLV